MDVMSCSLFPTLFIYNIFFQPNKLVKHIHCHGQKFKEPIAYNSRYIFASYRLSRQLLPELRLDMTFDNAFGSMCQLSRTKDRYWWFDENNHASYIQKDYEV